MCLNKVLLPVEDEEDSCCFQSKLYFAVFFIIYEYVPAPYLVNKPVPFTTSNSSFEHYSMLMKEDLAGFKDHSRDGSRDHPIICTFAPQCLYDTQPHV
jgi:hypothetical protein